jgi:hypothetical protein
MPKDVPRLTKIAFRPGINREQTSYSGEGGWYDGNLIRFRDGLPETFGGWAKINSSATAFVGTCRAMHPWIAVDGDDFLGFATNKKLYIEWAGTNNDITPLRTTVTLGANPFATTNGSPTVTVTHASHGAAVGDYVTFSSGDVVAGLDLDAEFAIATVPTANTYTITASSNASSTTSGGGASVSAAYQIAVGEASDVYGAGWGAGTWGSGTWGGSSASSVLTTRMRIWSMDNFGEDLFTCIRDGAVYYWDKTSGLSVRASLLSAISGASNTPTVATQVMVSTADRHALAFGANPLGSADQDKLLIRWSDSEDIADWTPTTTNEAGSLRLQTGSMIMSAVKTRQEIAVFTDRSLHSLRFTGTPFFFGEGLISDNVSIMGPNTAVAVEDAVIWMGLFGFYIYNGRVEPLHCTVEDYVFQDINRTQRYKVFAGVNGFHNEVIWFYPSASANECDRYVAYNYREKVWYYGTLVRTAWCNATTRIYPVGASATGYLYYHENGTTDDGSALQAYIESSMFDIEDGDRAMFVKRAVPDVTFNGSTAASPAVVYTFKTRMFPGSSNLETETGTVTRTASSPIETYTNQLHIRKRGRQMVVKIENTASGVRWRAGALRLDMRPDGKR